MPDGPKKSDTWAETGAPNGHKILADGTHLICDASQHAVLHLDDLVARWPPSRPSPTASPCAGRTT